MSQSRRLLGVVMDPIESIKPKKDSTLAMLLAAQRKGWDIGDVTVDVDYEPAQRGSPTRFRMVVNFPKELPEEQRERLMQIGAKCPVHRVLEGEVMFEETVELV